MALTSLVGTNPLKVAIIGAGEVGEKHAHAFRRLGSAVQLIGIADVNAARAASLARMSWTLAADNQLS